MYNNDCSWSKGQGHVTYWQQKCYNLAVDGHISFKLGAVVDAWYTFSVSRSNKPEVEIWRTFSI